MDINDVTVILPHIPRVFTAIAEWLAVLLCVSGLRARISGWKKILVICVMLLVQCSFWVSTKKIDGLGWIFCVGLGVLFMFLFIYICCDVKAESAGYYTAYAFIVAEFAAAFEWQIYCYMYETYFSEIIKYIYMIVIYGVIYLFLWNINRHLKSADKVPIQDKEFWTCSIIAGLVFFMSNIGFMDMTTPFSGCYGKEIFTIRTMVDFGGLALIYAYHTQWVNLGVRHELESVRNILHNQYVQYQQSQKTIQIINYKYHDLKHHIFALRQEEDIGKRNKYLDQMEAEIKNYELQNNTGNEVLDTLLTVKNMYCQQNQISLTAVVDGSLFGFMDVMDICSVFGNALDNAIECERKINEEEKRLIHVLAYSKMKFLIIRFENYYEGTLKFDGNLPVTTKGQAHFHGYGLKSLQYTVHKYGGEVDVSVVDNWFILKILIPVPA